MAADKYDNYAWIGNRKERNGLLHYEGFVLSVEGFETVTVRVGDDIKVLGSRGKKARVWLAKCCELFENTTTKKRSIKLAWYLRRDEIPDHIKSRHKFHQREIVLTEMTDTDDIRIIEGLVTVVNTIELYDAGGSDLYLCRYKYDNVSDSLIDYVIPEKKYKNVQRKVKNKISFEDNVTATLKSRNQTHLSSYTPKPSRVDPIRFQADVPQLDIPTLQANVIYNDNVTGMAYSGCSQHDLAENLPQKAPSTFVDFYNNVKSLKRKLSLGDIVTVRLKFDENAITSTSGQSIYYRLSTIVFIEVKTAGFGELDIGSSAANAEATVSSTSCEDTVTYENIKVFDGVQVIIAYA